MLQVQVITDLAAEPVTLEEAKNFMGIDFDDFDPLIIALITASRVASERVTGKAYGAKVVQVTGNTYEGRSDCPTKVYPITPYVSDVEDWADEDGNVDYQYNAGYTVCPPDLKIAILMRIATGFASRQDGISESINKAVNASIIVERGYVTQLAV